LNLIKVSENPSSLTSHSFPSFIRSSPSPLPLLFLTKMDRLTQVC
jgi:hypothetical protein